MRKLLVTTNNREYEVTSLEEGTISIDGRPVSIDLVELGGGQFSVRIEGRHYSGYVRSGEKNASANSGEAGRQVVVTIGDREYDVVVDDETSLLRKSFQGAREGGTGSVIVKAPMPGLVVKLDVSSGEHVKVGQPLLVLEAMKMENEIRTTDAGLIQTIHVQPGTAVEKGEPLVTISRE